MDDLVAFFKDYVLSGVIYLKLIVGLGNHGAKYAKTRHNTGFRAVKTIADEIGIQETDYRRNALWAEGEIAGRPVVLAQPCSYMNKSGPVVRKLLNEFELSPPDLIVIHDDLDLPVGKIRIKWGGSTAGHRGLDSIVNSIRTREFGRIRLGIGRPPKEVEVSSYVLTDFSEKEEELISEACSKTVSALEVLLKEGYQMAMNDFN